MRDEYYTIADMARLIRVYNSIEHARRAKIQSCAVMRRDMDRSGIENPFRLGAFEIQKQRVFMLPPMYSEN